MSKKYWLKVISPLDFEDMISLFSAFWTYKSMLLSSFLFLLSNLSFLVVCFKDTLLTYDVLKFPHSGPKCGFFFPLNLAWDFVSCFNFKALVYLQF